MSDANIHAWDQSYLRAENLVFYPHEGLVKFVNRYIRKRLGVNQFQDRLQAAGPPFRALDFGCGIGAGVLLLHEFGIEAHGVDISQVPIAIARQFAAARGLNIPDRFRVIQPNQHLPFPDGRFDLFVSCGALDSMPFAAARRNVLELARVTTRYGYFSVIAGDYRGFFGEEQVATAHEQNTIQSYFNPDKIQDLIADTGFAVVSCELVSSEICGQDDSRAGRYHVTLKKDA